MAHQTDTGTQAPTRLRTEHFIDPLGIDVRKPRFSWIMVDPRRGAVQSAYRLEVSANGEVVWDTGKVAGDRSVLIDYAGPVLQPRTVYQWKVRVWDGNGRESPWSEVATFETGLRDQSAWKASWIQLPIEGRRGQMLPAPCFRKEFSVGKEMSRARLYATALGVYEMSLNGKRVGDASLTPGWTDYFARVQYQTYDVTGMLREGTNAIGAMLGDGWYFGYITGAWERGEKRYGDCPKLMAQLIVDYQDGSSEIVGTDGSWKCTESGPVRYSDIYMGEGYDARNHMPGWDRPNFDDSSWSAVASIEPKDIQIEAQRGPLVRAAEEIKPVQKTRPANNTWIFNMGQNMVGRVRLNVKGPAGATVTIRHAEMLNPDGTLYTENLRGAKATAEYTLKGEGEEVWEPRFTFFGFQYVEITGFPGEPDLNSITGVVLHSDMEPAGSFECSDPLINQLQSNIRWGQRGNYLDVPTDCPQRDERLGWTGDAQVFMRTAAFNYDIAGFFTKWLWDLQDSQDEEGRYAHIAPRLPNNIGGGSAAWADAGIICPWTMYLCYGDTRVLAQHYESMKRWIEFLDSILDNDVCGNGGFGDWLSIDAHTPKELIGAAFYVYSSRLMARIARVLGKDDDAEGFEKRVERGKRGWQREFVTPNGRIIGDTQTAYVLALHFDLLPKEQRAAAAKRLVKNIRDRDTHLSCGFVGSPYINHVLTDTGNLDVAFDLLNQKSWPSWLYAVTKGATTIWERWDGWTEENGFQSPGMNSFNHYAYGAIGEWLYTKVAGLDLDPEQPAYKHVIIDPHPGGGLTHATAALDSEYGRIESGWELDSDTFTLSVLIPPNTTATIKVPADNVGQVSESGAPAVESEGVSVVGAHDGRVVFNVGAGEYCFGVAGA